ncbi:EF-P lysine aminoacylase EpmA [Thiomicrorhabdus sp. Kp2]|uniref:EF-P lysine aminoacylase EpmA n=1 Tax=Thiomicrorhabdus sp. Kp2 TaxID=1123518 RepID=UPI00040526BA|nr:EF-P lysine aminoacylase EpmA [Thiomicrorhabdus sp. Kp2]
MLNRRDTLQKRSNLLQQVRAFFYTRSVIEVDTPILSQAATPDVHLSSLSSQLQVPGYKEPKTYYLHTSPEYPMKRLLCEGSGDIFYLGKVFRDGDLSPRHQIEFTMLEWYRLGFSMHQLIDEVIELIQNVMTRDSSELLDVERLSYQQLFAKYAQIEDVFSATPADYQACLKHHSIPEIVGVDEDDKDLWEQLVLTEVIEPHLGNQQGKPAITVMYHYPAKDAALAQVSNDNPLVAERFEVFVNGMELANGYQELADAESYRQRFNESLQKRQEYQLPAVPLDENLLQTLSFQPLPDCSGVALGIDRLFALQQGFSHLEQGMSFGIEKA